MALLRPLRLARHLYPHSLPVYHILLRLPSGRRPAQGCVQQAASMGRFSHAQSL